MSLDAEFFGADHPIFWLCILEFGFPLYWPNTVVFCGFSRLIVCVCSVLAGWTCVKCFGCTYNAWPFDV
jgi:hypothetical protein